ncbi:MULTISPECIES: metal-dependent hydrolase [Halomicrobium]|uniref:Membrane-bound metal-dependent hydrolase n=2 Tax=Halomicrobium mukohataei TaxID=57705 RepID=C7NW18_HALMD|nr:MULTISPECIES: metal-dependent hydrolase [Halomicrobium]ACV48147.1 membrane-bound metal-dependent hydrolase [Halomicrobium mukohataei DSM 12286]QCD66571.1 hydrolase [Halomicrobium mukohataei]QFR21377.1 hydrolase [Halomicrobium sp. ZPS1]
MWPWEHLACGYVALSVLSRLRDGDRPTGPQTVAVAVGTQFPDLVDKPLGWGTTLLPSGISLAHSLLVAVPLSAAVVAVARETGHGRVGWAFAIGYLAHLPGDVVYPMALGGPPRLAFLLWPLTESVASAPVSITGHVWALLAQFVALLATPAGRVYVVLELLLVGGAILAWVLDETPLVPDAR